MHRIIFDAGYVSFKTALSGVDPHEYITEKIRLHGADCAHVCMDSATNWRHGLLPTYKAHRPQTPHEVISARAELASRACAITVPGMEADDVIAALCNLHRDDVITIIANDKDLMQLVSPMVTVNGLNPDGVIAKYGVPPQFIRPWLAVMGDASDNIPGVPGYGAVKSARAVNEASGMLGMLNPFEPKFQIFAERIRLNYEIVGLRHDCLDDCHES